MDKMTSGLKLIYQAVFRKGVLDVERSRIEKSGTKTGKISYRTKDKSKPLAMSNMAEIMVTLSILI